MGVRKGRLAFARHEARQKGDARYINDPKTAIKEACSIMALAWRAIDPEARTPSDGFCEKCPHGPGAGGEQYYRNAGLALAYIRLAVLRQLKRDGINVPDGFDPRCGREKDDVSKRCPDVYRDIIDPAVDLRCVLKEGHGSQHQYVTVQRVKEAVATTLRDSARRCGVHCGSGDHRCMLSSCHSGDHEYEDNSVRAASPCHEIFNTASDSHPCVRSAGHDGLHRTGYGTSW
jgi:hypothetical protein